MCTAMKGTGRGSLRASAANMAGVRCLEITARSDIASGKDASRKTAFRSGDAPAARQNASVGPVSDGIATMTPGDSTRNPSVGTT